MVLLLIQKCNFFIKLIQMINFTYKKFFSIYICLNESTQPIGQPNWQGQTNKINNRICFAVTISYENLNWTYNTKIYTPNPKMSDHSLRCNCLVSHHLLWLAIPLNHPRRMILECEANQFAWFFFDVVVLTQIPMQLSFTLSIRFWWDGAVISGWATLELKRILMERMYRWKLYKTSTQTILLVV